MDCVIRDAVEADRAAILSIGREGEPGVTALTSAQVDDCLTRATLFCVAERNREVCAYLIGLAPDFESIGDEYTWFSARYRTFLYVDQVAVAESARRNGVATALYTHVEREARARGMTRITCDVNLRPHNPESLAFHAGLGFVEVGRLEVSDGRHVALLAKALEATP